MELDELRATADELREAAAQLTWRADRLRGQADTMDTDARRFIRQAAEAGGGGRADGTTAPTMRTDWMTDE